MIKAILFDMGGVFLEGTVNTFVNGSYSILGIDKTFVAEQEVTYDEEFNRGNVSIEDCFRGFFNVPIDERQMKEIIELWKFTWKPTENMINLLKNLKKNYRIGVLSNSDPVNSKVNYDNGIYDMFDFLVLSHEEHTVKPEKRIYDIAVERADAPPSECIFIDDQEECLKPARDMGMKTILFRGYDGLLREFDRIGIEH